MDLQNLVDVAEQQRDESWENNFFQKLTAGHVNLLYDEPQMGPDGWPYLLGETAAEAGEPVAHIFSWLKTKGIGFVVNPQKEYPDYVFTYGMLWHFMETGLFFRPQAMVNSGQALLSLSDLHSSGNPPESYLPSYVRQVLREFLKQQAVEEPKILAVNLKEGRTELIFSLESLNNPPEHEHQGIAEALSWFLPPHYSILLMGEKGLPQFHQL